MARYSKKSQETVEDAMHRYKRGKLKSGSGRKVKSKDQAIAIGLSEAREKGAKVPNKKTSAKKGRKTASKKTSARKSTGRKTAAKKSRKTTAQKGRPASKKTAAKKSRKTASKKGRRKSASR